MVDADYVSTAAGLRSLVSYFDDPKVGVVQAPQAHRAWVAADLLRRFMNWEYDGFLLPIACTTATSATRSCSTAR